jgi:predicted anti-sigma-YlaC factor YlaD
VKCKTFISELADYFDEDLDPLLRAEVEAHLAKCKNCRIVVDTCKKTIQIYCNSEPAPIPADVSSRLKMALEKRLRRQRA